LVQRYAAVWSEQSAGIALPMAAMTVGRGRGKGAIVNQLRFEAGLGHYSVNVAPDSVWIFRGMGTHYFQVQLQIGIPEVGAGAGRLLCVETTLYAPEGSGPRVPLASTNASVPFNPEGEVRSALDAVVANWIIVRRGRRHSVRHRPARRVRRFDLRALCDLAWRAPGGPPEG
jgi:hypothetical protein